MFHEMNSVQQGLNENTHIPRKIIMELLADIYSISFDWN